MSVYVDRVRDWGGMVKGYARRHGTKWSHLIADTEKELHAFALSIGLKPEWAQYPGTSYFHYDVIPSKRALAIKRGAIEVDDKTFLEIRKSQRTARALQCSE